MERWDRFDVTLITAEAQKIIYQLNPCLCFISEIQGKFLNIWLKLLVMAG